MKRLRLRLAAIAALSTIVPQVHAGLLYDNGVAISDIDNALNVNLNPTGPYYADDFTLASAAVVDEVRWTGIYSSVPIPPADDFTLRFYDFNGAVASDTPLYTFHVGDSVNRTDLGNILAPLPAYRLFSYRAAIPPTLFAGRYLISIKSEAAGPVQWYWSVAYNQGNGLFFAEPFSVAQPDSFDFQLHGAAAGVPEPSTFLLGALGVAGGLVLRRRSAAGRRFR